MACVAGYNFHSVSELLNSPMDPVRKSVATLGQEPSRLLLRHHAAEINRTLFDYWEDAQFAIGVLLILFLVLGTERRILPPVICGLMLIILVFQHFNLTPEMIARGREADFPPGDLNQALHTRLALLHRIYVGVEGVKLLAGAVLESYLFAFRTKRRRRRTEDKLIDHPDHSHINR